jgi:4-coumarate--CoA ligase
MPTKSPYQPLDIPEKNIIHYLFRLEQPECISDQPIWIDSSDLATYLTPRQLLQWATRLAVGLDRFRDAHGDPAVQSGHVVLIFSPNQVMIPVAYLGSVGSGRIFSGVNATFSIRGKHPSFWPFRGSPRRPCFLFASQLR